ncbi:MAG TPA: hypothetical protein VJT32_09310 [bacterium]|nr:hypothetical protein [bacterium]
MAVPVTTTRGVQDRAGQPVQVGDMIRVEGLADPAEVQVVDPRYGVLVVVVPGRVGKMGRMVYARAVERLSGAPQK